MKRKKCVLHFDGVRSEKTRGFIAPSATQVVLSNCQFCSGVLSSRQQAEKTTRTLRAQRGQVFHARHGGQTPAQRRQGRRTTKSTTDTKKAGLIGRLLFDREPRF